MRDFGALLVHVRDIRAELASLSYRVAAIENGRGVAAVSARLHDAVAQYFSGAELRMLAHEAGADIEEIGGEGLTEQALNLVLWARRRGRGVALLGLLAAKRPAVDWGAYE